MPYIWTIVYLIKKHILKSKSQKNSNIINMIKIKINNIHFIEKNIS